MTAPLVIPQAPEAEEAVLGALLTAGTLGLDRARAVTDDVRAVGLEPCHFFGGANGKTGCIYSAQLSLVDRGIPPVPALVGDELGDNLEEVGGLLRLHALAAIQPATANAPHFARLVVETWHARVTLRLAGRVARNATNGYDPAAAAELAEALREHTHLRPGHNLGALEPLDLALVLAAKPPSARWRWRGWVAEGDLALTVGDPGVGKSLLWLGVSNGVRRGTPVLGEPCSQGRVAIFDYENPLDEAHKRLHAAGLNADDHDGLAYFHAPALDLGSREGQRTFADTLEHHRIDIAIVDSLRRAAPGLDENDSAAVSAVLSPLRALTQTTGRTVVLVHHPRKRSGDNPTEAGQMVRGSLDLVASVDTLLYLRTKEPGQFTLEQAKSRRGQPHESILVSITEADDGRLELVNEGPVATADDKVEGLLARVIAALRDDGGALDLATLALRVGAGNRDRTLQRALSLGRQRGLLATNEDRKVGEKALYALAPEMRT